MKKIVAIIQARLASTRLPRKILRELLPGRTALSCMLERVGKSKLIQSVVVATTTNSQDQELILYLEQIKQPFFVGDENDVLDRYYQTAKAAGLSGEDVVVRLTSDCPAIDPAVIDEVIQYYLDGGFDYAANGLEPYTYPDGMDTEVFSFAQLERAHREATKPSHREHVTFYFWTNPQLFKIGKYKNKNANEGGYRLTLDYPEDYALLSQVYAALYPKNPKFTMNDIIDFLEQHPEVKNLNAKFARNASWKSA